MRLVDIDLDKLVEYHKKGYTDEIIAQKLGVSRATVVRRRKQLGLKANRKRGERGPGKVKEESMYFKESMRLMKYIGGLIYQAAAEYLAKTGDESKAWLATIVEPGTVPHPAPGAYYKKPENTDLGAVKFICDYERKADLSGMAGVPGPAIIELAKVYKTADEETKRSLAMKAVIEAGFVNVISTVKEVIEKGTMKLEMYKQIWSQRLKDACSWAPLKVDNSHLVRTFRFKALSYGRSRTATGQLGKQGGIRNIQVRRALLGVAGY